MKTELKPAPGNNANLDVDVMTNENDLLNYLNNDKTEDEDGNKITPPEKIKPEKPIKKEDDEPTPRQKPKSKPASDEDEPDVILDDTDEDEDEQPDKKKGKKKTTKEIETGSDDDGIDLLDDEDEEEEEEDDDEALKDEDPGYIISQLKKDHGLDYKLDKLKAAVAAGKFTKKQEAAVVSELFGTIVKNANARLAQYKGIDALIKNEEVAHIITKLKEGKTLKDIAGDYATSVGGLSDEDVVGTDIKKRYAGLTDEEISDQVAELKKKGTLPKMANAVREQVKQAETLTAQQKVEQATRDAQERKQEIEEDMVQFADFLKQVKSVHGVPVTSEMKKAAFVMTTVRDENGDTELDRMLLSNRGSLLAALGIKFMKNLMRGAGTSSSNKGRKSVLDILDDTAENLQSGGTRSQSKKKAEEAELFNKF